MTDAGGGDAAVADDEGASTDFERTPMRFVDRVTADGVDGWPVEAGRYRLVINRACTRCATPTSSAPRTTTAA